MDAPRQKLMKERATVVATTTLGFVSAAASRPSCEDIYINSILRLSAGTAPLAKAALKSLVETSREESGQARGPYLGRRPVDVVDHAAKLHRALLR